MRTFKPKQPKKKWHRRKKGKKKAKSSHRKSIYNAYMNSPEWKQKRSEVLAHYGAQCMECGTEQNLHVHHKRYAKNLGDEDVRDFEVLCAGCHALRHAGGVGPNSPKEAIWSELVRMRNVVKGLVYQLDQMQIRVHKEPVIPEKPDKITCN